MIIKIYSFGSILKKIGIIDVFTLRDIVLRFTFYFFFVQNYSEFNKNIMGSWRFQILNCFTPKTGGKWNSMLLRCNKNNGIRLDMT